MESFIGIDTHNHLRIHAWEISYPKIGEILQLLLFIKPLRESAKQEMPRSVSLMSIMILSIFLIVKLLLMLTLLKDLL